MAGDGETLVALPPRTSAVGPPAAGARAAALPSAPLSYGQQRMWVLTQLAPTSAALNLVMAVRLVGALNTAALRHAFDDLFARHEALRTVIVVAEGEPRQQVTGARQTPLTLVDVAGLRPRDAHRSAELLLREQTERAFDLTRGPVARVCLIRVRQEVHLVCVAIHHAFTDGWSMGVLAEEIAAAYRAHATTAPSPRTETPAVRYRDFATWQRAQPDRPSWAPRAARLAEIAGIPPAWGAPPPDRRSRVARRCELALPPSLTERLHQLRRSHGGSMFMLIAAALMTVIHRLDDRAEVAIGTLAAGRTQPEFERIIGYFGNVLVLRAAFAPTITFREAWRQVREECVDAYAHQDVPYERLLAQARMEHGAHLPAPVSVLCVPHQPPPTLEVAGLRAEAVDVPHGAALFDLTVEIQERAGALRLTMSYDTDVLDESTVALLGRYLRDVLAQAATNIDTRCRDIRLSSPAQPTHPPADDGEPGTLSQYFERQVTATPDAVALSHAGRAVSYRALNAAANRLARHLRDAGVRVDDPVGVCLPRSIESVIAMLAILKAGAGFLPLDPAYPSERLCYVVRDSRVRWVVTTTDHRQLVRAAPNLIPLDADAPVIAALPATNLGLSIPSDSLAYLMYTSGSTSQPKGVLGPHRGIVNRLRWMWRRYPYRPSERACHRTPMSFIDSISEIFGPLLAGVPAEIFDDHVVTDPRAFAATLARAGASRVLLVPSLLRVLLDIVPELAADTPALWLWVCSGEPLTSELVKRFHEALPGRVLLNLFGSTEVAADATAAEVEAERVCIGRPIDGVRTTVVAEWSGEPAPALVAGELWVGGAAVARGYHGRPSSTAARFVPDPAAPSPGGRAYRTGDRVRQRADAQLDFLGRMDDQVQIRGIRVEPGEVEAALHEHADVLAAAVTAWPDAAGSSTLAAYVVPRATLSAERLRAYLRQRLPAHAVPSAIVGMATLPRTPSGKIDRRRLPRPEQLPGDAVSANPAEAPRDGFEAAVAEIFTELLPVRWRDVNDDFFALGGHSILAIMVLHRLRERCGVELRLRDMFAAPSIAGIARLADRALPAAQAVPVVRDPERQLEPFPLTDVQQAYWVGRAPEFQLGNIATHAYFEINAWTHIRAADLATAIDRLVQRHAALRTVIRPDGQQQVLRHAGPYHLKVVDLCGAGRRATRRRLARLRAQLSHQVLPADRWPLFDIRLVRRDAGRDRLLVSIDALVADAYSVGILMDELAALYHDPTVELPPLELTFRDCVLASLRQRELPAYQASLAYWRARLDDLPAGPDLPLVRQPAELDRPAFRRWSTTMPQHRWARLRQAAAHAELTPAALLLAAFAEVLTAWSARSHYTLTLTLFTRPYGHPHVDRVVGDFTSLTLLEIDHRRAGSFLDRARAVQERMWADLDHRDVSGVTVLRELTQRQGGRPSLRAPVVFTSNLGLRATPAANRRALGDLGFALTQTPQLYLDHQVAESADGLVLSWDVVEALFPPGLVGDMHAAYLRLLTDLADGARAWDAPVGDLLPPHQRARRATVNLTDRPYPQTALHELVSAAARISPDACAVMSASGQITHGALQARVERLGDTLRRHAGVCRGDLVGIVVPKGWQQIVAVLAVHAAAAAYVPMEPTTPDSRLVLLAEQTGLRCVLTVGAMRERLRKLTRVAVLAIDEAEGPAAVGAADASATPTPTASGRPSATCADATMADLAYVIFTSGSTGIPKGVMINHRGAVNTVSDINGRWDVNSSDRVLALSALSFDLSVWDIFGLLARGGAIVLPDPDRLRDPAHWVELVARMGVTIWNSVPALMNLATEYAAARAPDALRGLRLVLLSGDWIPLDLPERIRALAPGATIVSLGGATEASIWSVYYQLREISPDWVSVPYGRPLANQRLYVLDEQGRSRPDWVPGELYIGGDGVALGYWAQPAQTAERFTADPATGSRLYRTGDLARFRPDGEIEFLGRTDRQVKINGFRVELGEVESALSRVPGVANAAVVAVGKARSERRLAAFYVARPTAELSASTLRRELGAVLPEYLIPHTFTGLAALPLTANGKVDYAALAGPGGASAQRPGPPAGDGATELEAALASIWATVLDVERVAANDSFFELGGTSLVAIRLLGRLEEAYGVKIPLVRLYEAPTVARLAAEILERRPSVRRAPAPSTPAVAAPDEWDRPFPLTPIQEAYWLGRHRGLTLGGVATHSYVELDVADLDLDRLDRAVGALVERHDALRTVIRPDGQARVVAVPAEYRIPRADLRGLPPDDLARYLDRQRSELSHRVTSADRWPLFDIRASILRSGRVRLHIGVDLIIADAFSFRILQRELMEIYRADGVALPTPGLTFRDYVLAVTRRRDGAEYRAARAYWSKRLGSLPPTPPLPRRNDPHRPSQRRFTRLTGNLGAAAWMRLKRLAAASSLTPSGVLCAAYADVLAMWSQCGRFTINLTTFNRLPIHPDIDAVVGDFTSTTLLAVDATASTFTERAVQSQRQIFADLEHREFSGVEVLRMLRGERTGRPELSAPIVFTSILVDDSVDAPTPTWNAEVAFSVSQTPQVLLDHQTYEHRGDLVYTWDYVEDAFPPMMVAAMFDAYGRLLASLAGDRGYWRAGVAWPAGAERRFT